jgi:hypothetical protein
MVFVSYSHEDNEWRKRFLKIASPLARYLNIDFWSDKDIKASSDWKEEICKAMSKTRIAESDFIANEEMPFFLAEATAKKVNILWILLTPCLWEKTGLKSIQACCTNTLKPLMDMSECGWREELCNLARRIDDLERVAETPVINLSLSGHAFSIKEKLQVLAKPALREVEVLVYAGDGKWYVQEKIQPGETKATCWIGDHKHTKKGDAFKIIAITADGPPLKTGSSYRNIPSYRSKSEEVSVRRA